MPLTSKSTRTILDETFSVDTTFPSIRISKTLVTEFYKKRKGVQDGRRLGQAFHQHFDMTKVTGSDKAWLDKLYEADGWEAKNLISLITDENN